MSRPTPPSYKTRNWPAYNEALKRRSSLTIWCDPSMIWEATPTGKRRRQPYYSDAAIELMRWMPPPIDIPARFRNSRSVSPALGLTPGLK